jgi:hypothetical protein
MTGTMPKSGIWKTVKKNCFTPSDANNIKFSFRCSIKKPEFLQQFTRALCEYKAFALSLRFVCSSQNKGTADV